MPKGTCRPSAQRERSVEPNQPGAERKEGAERQRPIERGTAPRRRLHDDHQKTAQCGDQHGTRQSLPAEPGAEGGDKLDVAEHESIAPAKPTVPFGNRQEGDEAAKAAQEVTLEIGPVEEKAGD